MKRRHDDGEKSFSGWRVSSLAACGLLAAGAAGAAEEWASGGFGADNSAFNPQESVITAGNVSKLKLKWTFTTAGDVSVRAAVAENTVYFPDWGGNLWALDQNTGKTLWGNQLSSYGLPSASVSRTTPAVHNGVVYLGTQQGAWFIAVNARTGKLIWKTQLESKDPYAVVTTSPSFVDNVVYTGVASTQEANPGGAPGTARGSVVALDAFSGKILWKTYTTPVGYTGAGVWGSSPVIDTKRGTLFIGTGDNYTAPTDPAYLACVGGGGTAAACNSPDNHVDSILALDIYTGKFKWTYRALDWNQKGVTNGSDFFNLTCIEPFLGGVCPSPTGPDYDFGAGPSEITYATPTGPRTILGAGQKSGIYYAFDPDTGELLWQTQVGPGSSLGGVEWGSATDGKRIYVQISNYYGIPWSGNGASGSAGFFAALDPATGAVLWRTPDPNGTFDLGAVSVANGVVYAPSMAPKAGEPNMLALDANSGKILWQYAAGSTVLAGAAIVKGGVYWGSGYSHLGPFLPFSGGKTFYAFTLDGK
jgi:polyvinyl alcohol dehydrogenase (cytochrome)